MEPFTAIAPLLAAGNGWVTLVIFAIIAILSAISKIREQAIKKKQEHEQAMRPQKMPQQQQQRPPLRRQMTGRMPTEDFEDDEMSSAPPLPTGVRRMPSQPPPMPAGAGPLPRRPIPPIPRVSRKHAPAVEVIPQIVQQADPQQTLAAIDQQMAATSQRLAMLKAKRTQLLAETQSPGRLNVRPDAPVETAILGLNLRDEETARRAMVLLEVMGPPLALRDE